MKPLLGGSNGAPWYLGMTPALYDLKASGGPRTSSVSHHRPIPGVVSVGGGISLTSAVAFHTPYLEETAYTVMELVNAEPSQANLGESANEALGGGESR